MSSNGQIIIPLWGNVISRHSKSGFLCAVKNLLLTTLRRKMANKSVNLLIKWVKLNKKFRWIKSWIFQLAYTNLKTVRKVRKFLCRCMKARLWHLETLVVSWRNWPCLCWEGYHCGDQRNPFNQRLLFDQTGQREGNSWKLLYYKCSEISKHAMLYSKLKPQQKKRINNSVSKVKSKLLKVHQCLHSLSLNHWCSLFSCVWLGANKACFWKCFLVLFCPLFGSKKKTIKPLCVRLLTSKLRQIISCFVSK